MPARTTFWYLAWHSAHETETHVLYLTTVRPEDHTSSDNVVKHFLQDSAEPGTLSISLTGLTWKILRY